MLAHGVVDGLIEPLWAERAADFPLTMWVVEPAQGIIVHSRYAEERLRELGFRMPVWRVPMPAWPLPAVEASRSSEAPVIGCFGHLNREKRIPQLLDAFARVRQRHPGLRLVLGGSVASGIDLPGLVSSRNLEDAVIRHDYLGEQELWEEIAGTDVLVSLRSPTMGETSGMVVRALSLGKPLVVSDVGSFVEIPDNVAAKVPVDETETEALERILEELVTDPGLRSRMGEAAAEWGRTEHDLDRSADLYVAALEEAAGLRQVEEAVLRDVASAAADLGIDAASPELAEVGDRLHGAWPGPKTD
jgi:glycosyltransferase involved in cell wall biosynthesis